MDAYRYASNENENFSLRWVQGAKPELAGIQGGRPYVLSGTSMTSSVHIDLYASRSRSFPYYSKKGTWEGLIPTWKFKDADANIITSLDVTGTSGENGVYTYTASAWYVDDLCTEKRTSVYLWATMEMSANTVSGEYGMPSYANSKVFDVCEAKIGRVYPDKMRLTSDGYTPLSSYYHWTNHVTPAVITLHSNYYDIFKDDKISTTPGVIFDFPYSASALVPFYCTPITSRTITQEFIGLSSVSGKIVYDEEGMPVSSTIPNYHYKYTPVTHFEDYNYPYVMSSLYTQSSAYDDIETYGNETEILITSSMEHFKCPVFARYDTSEDKYFIGGYTIGNFTMPDKSYAGGERYKATLSIEESAPAYLPPYSMWISNPTLSALVIVPFKTVRGEDDSIESPYGNIPITHVTDVALTPSMEEYSRTAGTSAYHVENVHGIYFMAKDFEYNVWTLDTELARLVKYDAYGKKTNTEINLNDSFWNWVNTSADEEQRTLARKYYGKPGESSADFDYSTKSLQPSYIVLSPEQDVLSGGKPGIYVAYHDSYLVTTHDLDGNIIDADFSNPSGYKGYTYELDNDRTFCWGDLKYTYSDTSNKMSETDRRQVAAKGFHAETDNINKPGIMALWGDHLYVTYSSTSKGIDAETFEDLSNQTESKLVVYARELGVHHDRWESIEYTWDLDFGEMFEDLCMYKGVAYALILNNKHQAKFVSFSISEDSSQSAQDPETIIEYGTIEDPGYLTITEDGVAWFCSKGNQVIAYDISTKECYCFTNLYKQSYWKDFTIDSLSGSMAIRQSDPVNGRYTEHEFLKIDGMSVDTDDYLWIIDNHAEYPIQAFDTHELLELARRHKNTAVDAVNAITYDDAKLGIKIDKNQVSPAGTYTTVAESPYNVYTWESIRNQDPRHDCPTFMNNGDWTGIRYEILLNQCYKPRYATLDSSHHFVMNYDRLRFRRFNESRDIIPDMKSCIRTGKFKEESNTFWDEFINAMIGGVDNEHYHLGRRLYERIGNIVPNLHDIEDANYNIVSDMAKMQDIPITQYNMSPPETLKRLFDILSCPHERIWGDRCHCTFNYKEINKQNENRPLYCENCGHWHRSNLGFKFDIYGRNLFTDQSPYVVKNPMDRRSKFIKIIPSRQSIIDAMQVLKRINTSKNGWNIDDYAEACFGKIDNKPTDTCPLTDEFIESINKLDESDNSPMICHLAKLLAIHTQFFIADERWYDQCLWEFRYDECLNQNIGIVKWEDEYTAFPENANSVSSFYRSPSAEYQKENGEPVGYLELILNYLLHNGLLFHKDKHFFEN